MHEVHFADGFDGPEPVAFGLAPAQLLTVVAGLLAAHALVQSALPRALALPAAAVLALAACLLGWLRLQGRPAREWAVLGTRHLVGPRTGMLRITSEEAAAVAPAECSPAPAAGEATGAARGTSRRVAFFSLSGGVGRTALATEVASLLSAAAGPGSVALVDTDPLNGSVGLRLGVRPSPAWEWAGRRPAPQVAGGIARRVEGGLAVIAGCPRPLLPEAQALFCERLQLEVERLEEGGVRLSVLDIGPGLGPAALWALGTADSVCVVLTPTPTGIQDAYRSTDVLRHLGRRSVIAYALNRCGEGAIEAEGLEEVMADLGGRLVARVPRDDRFDEVERRHRPLSPDASGTIPGLRELARWAAGEAWR